MTTAVAPQETGVDLLASVGPIVVIDDVLPDPRAYREAALALSFGDVPAGDQVFKGIAVPTTPFLQILLSQTVGCGPTTLTFFRKSPAGQLEPNYIHSDRDMGDWTAILYLNPDPPAGDGTSFWMHRATGQVSGEFDADAARDVSQWECWRHVDAKFGRLLIFQSDYFHSRGIEQNYGAGDSARLIQVAFGRRPVPAGETVIRPATYADIPQIVDMGLNFLRTTEYRGRIVENPNQMAHVASFLLQDASRALFVAESRDRLVGMIGLVLFPQPLSGELTAGEWFWWVEPDARRSRAGLKLLARAEAWAKEAGAAVIQMIAPNAEVERLYVARGYDRIEVSYQRRVS